MVTAVVVVVRTELVDEARLDGGRVEGWMALCGCLGQPPDTLFGAIQSSPVRSKESSKQSANDETAVHSRESASRHHDVFLLLNMNEDEYNGYQSAYGDESKEKEVRNPITLKLPTGRVDRGRSSPMRDLQISSSSAQHRPSNQIRSQSCCIGRLYGRRSTILRLPRGFKIDWYQAMSLPLPWTMRVPSNSLEVHIKVHLVP